VTLTFTDNTVLTAGVLVDGRVRNLVQREYIFHGFVPYTATVYIKDPTVSPNNWGSVYVYAWDNTGAITDTWPGVRVTGTKTVMGQKFYYRTFNVNSEDYIFNVVLSQGDSEHQSVDVTGIKNDIYLEITSTSNKYTVADITDQYSRLPGDVDGDRIIGMDDLSLLINYLLTGNAAGVNLVNADVDMDEIIGMDDLAELINILLTSN
jgi:hypothetical protein